MICVAGSGPHHLPGGAAAVVLLITTMTGLLGMRPSAVSPPAEVADKFTA